jgi:hypothetical protein
MKQNNPNENFNIDEVVIQVKRSWNQTRDTIRKRDNKVKTEPVIETESKASELPTQLNIQTSELFA